MRESERSPVFSVLSNWPVAAGIPEVENTGRPQVRQQVFVSGFTAFLGRGSGDVRLGFSVGLAAAHRW